MLPGITTEQMIEVDRIMMQDYNIPVELMMEHAGVNFAGFATEVSDSARFVVVAGSGNNGAGGITAARKLIGWGHSVIVVLPKGKVNLRKTAVEQLERVLQIAPNTPIIEDLQLLPDYLPRSTVLDAYIGYGFRGILDDRSQEVLGMLQRHKRVISLDSPSGVNTTTGENQGGLRPVATLTLAFPKEGLWKAGAEALGKLYVVDIGVPKVVFTEKLGIKWQNIEELDKLYESFTQQPCVDLSGV